MRVVVFTSLLVLALATIFLIVSPDTLKSIPMAEQAVLMLAIVVCGQAAQRLVEVLCSKFIGLPHSCGRPLSK